MSKCKNKKKNNNYYRLSLAYPVDTRIQYNKSNNTGDIELSLTKVFTIDCVLTRLGPGLPRAVHSHFDRLHVGGHLWRARTHRDRQGEAFPWKLKKGELTNKIKVYKLQPRAEIGDDFFGVSNFLPVVL